MSREALFYERHFEVEVTFKTRESAKRALGTLFSHSRGRSVRVLDEWVAGRAVELIGVYSVHGNGIYDVARMLASSLRQLEDVERASFTCESKVLKTCGDASCAACGRSE